MSQGITRSILKLLEDLGEVPSELRVVICEQSNEEILTKWLKLAARSKNIEEFANSLEVFC